jgi:hypothetical protein
MRNYLEVKRKAQGIHKVVSSGHVYTRVRKRKMERGQRKEKKKVGKGRKASSRRSVSHVEREKTDGIFFILCLELLFRNEY